MIDDGNVNMSEWAYEVSDAWTHGWEDHGKYLIFDDFINKF
jgi:hypothetical protein